MPEIVLPRPRSHQADKLLHPARHKVLACGRRWGKTHLGVHAAICGHGPNLEHIGALQGGSVWVLDQNHPSASTLWYAIRGILRPVAKHISESNRRILLAGGGSVSVKSAVNVNSLVGDIRGLDGVVMNEAAKFDPLVWQKAIRPALSDRKGWSIWPSTPEGLNYFHSLYEYAAHPKTEYQDAKAGDGEWAGWREPSLANKHWDAAEIEASKREGIAPLLLRQEYFAEFVVMGSGRAYHEFAREDHVRPVEYDPALPLDLCVSYEFSPSAWLITQGTKGNERVIAEILPPVGTSTRDYAAEFRRRFPRHAGGDRMRLFGEVGKGAGYSDFEALRAEFPRVQSMYRNTPYDEKDRVNSVNAVLRNRFAEIGGRIDPSCENTIRDLEGTLNANGSYKIDSRTRGIGHYAAAWGAKLKWLYPAIAETMRAQREERNEWGFPISDARKRKCYDLYWTAVRQGKIIRPNACEKCGKVGPVQADHRDHDKPYEVTHMCAPCHRAQPAAIVRVA